MAGRPLQSVVYVDDEPDIREVVAISLGLDGKLAVHTCDSGEAALRSIAVLHPDLVLLDVMMPGLDGPATLAHLRADPALRSIPVVFMTAKALPAEVQRFRELGAVAVIPKPFDPLKLAGQLRAIWDGLPDG